MQTIDSAKAKIIWFLYGDPVFTASSRIHGLAVYQALIRLGYNSFVAYLPRFTEEEIPFGASIRNFLEHELRPGDVLIFQKIKEEINSALLDFLRSLNVKLVLVDCDWPVAREVGRRMDLIICTSKLLRDIYIQSGLRALFIEDCPEVFYEKRETDQNEKLTCIWFGYSTLTKWKEVVWLEDLFKDTRLRNWTLKTISNDERATVRWAPDFFKVLETADVVALPAIVNDDASSVKSANRVLQSMALSLPVICSPLASYRDVITSGRDGFICDAREEWIAALQKLEDAPIRSEMGRAAFDTARNFSLDKLIDQWINALQLDESFRQINQQDHELFQRKLYRSFYGELILRNPYYFSRIKFSRYALVRMTVSVFLKIKKKVKNFFR